MCPSHNVLVFLRYTFVSDVEVEFSFIRENWPKSEELNMIDITHKLTTLSAMASASGVSVFQHLNDKFTIQEINKIPFSF